MVCKREGGSSAASAWPTQKAAIAHATRQENVRHAAGPPSSTKQNISPSRACPGGLQDRRLMRGEDYSSPGNETRTIATKAARSSTHGGRVARPEDGVGERVARVKCLEEARRRFSRTNPRLGFQPSRVSRVDASERKKRSRYPCSCPDFRACRHARFSREPPRGRIVRCQRSASAAGS